jgi:Ca2+-binding RTX toxin-like protein
MAARRRRRAVGARGLAPALAAVAVVISVVAFAAANAVPATNADRFQTAIVPNALKPAACAGITVTTLRIVSGIFNGTNADELILGSEGIDTIDGRAGTDCIVGGAGADVIRGGGQADVCIGGPGIDVFTSCQTQIQ